MGVFELLAVTDAVRALVTQGADAQRLRDAARAEGMTTLVEEGARLVGEGATTREEVDRVLVGAI
jgi:type II secretory ATPase GspE/PulE/Tfp pilus assembly ATPase PilB-like protein